MYEAIHHLSKTMQQYRRLYGMAAGFARLFRVTPVWIM